MTGNPPAGCTARSAKRAGPFFQALDIPWVYDLSRLIPGTGCWLPEAGRLGACFPGDEKVYNSLSPRVVRAYA